MPFVPSIGTARRSQAIFAYGTGAIVDFAGGSFMPLGLQHMEWQWGGLPREERQSLRIHEARLQKLLNVREFLALPVPGDGQLNEYGNRVERSWGVPAIRFPRWLECPRCHRLGRVGDPFEVQPDESVRCTMCSEEVTPVRFIVACRSGHIDDFPWIDWAHRTTGTACASPVLYLRSGGRSTALADLYVECTCGARESLGGIFRRGAFGSRRCDGSRPWLLHNDRNCGRELETLQRGGSNVCFPVTASMLSIPPASESIAVVLESQWSWLAGMPDNALLPALQGYLERENLSIDAELAAEWVRRRRNLETDPQLVDERGARAQEFEALCERVAAVPAGDVMPEFENEPFAAPPELQDWIDLISAVRRLREVRALCGFSRIQPYPVNVEDIDEAIRARRIAPLSATRKDWRPAVEIRGEGIFFRLREERLAQWAAQESIRQRAELLDEILARHCSSFSIPKSYVITPRHLLVHSLAHILLRRLSLDCGYSSASLRERLYISEGEEGNPPMAGLLIYTASPDSDGSLGGLVNLAEPRRVVDLVRSAVADAFWCGNDPVCIETDPRTHGERLTGACCHNCLLVPETACERFNHELDRGMLIGFSETGTAEGYFSDLPVGH